VEALLWKSVFYRYIEDYRRRIRRYAAAAAAGEPLAQESLDKARARCAQGLSNQRACSRRSAQAADTFCAFLSDGIAYYTGLVRKLQARERQRSALC
jgi:hypothetical protein